MALAADGELIEGSVYYSAEFKELTAEDLVNTNYIIEQWDDTAYDLCNRDDLELFENIDAHAVDTLRGILSAWINTHIDMSRAHQYVNGSSTEHAVTAEQIKEYLEGEQ